MLYIYNTSKNKKIPPLPEQFQNPILLKHIYIKYWHQFRIFILSLHLHFITPIILHQFQCFILMYQMISSNLSFNVYVHEIQISWLIYLLFFYYYWVDNSDGGLLVPEGTGSIPLLVDYQSPRVLSIIRPVVSVSALTWFICTDIVYQIYLLLTEIYSS